jgi:DNA-binding NarL/FixJ family response regulator
MRRSALHGRAGMDDKSTAPSTSGATSFWVWGFGVASLIIISMPGASTIRILATDDHPLIRAGLVLFLATEPGLEVVAEAGNGEEALEKYRELRPDIVLMDLSMPVMDGLAATRAILDEFPDARVIVLTTYGGDEDIHRALDAGAMGYLVKDMVAGEVLNVIRTVNAGRRGIPQPIAAKLAEHTPRIPLTPRETEVLSLVAKGLSNAEVAARIGRTEGTVKVHLKNILQKLGANDRTEAVTTALRRGFIRLE